MIRVASIAAVLLGAASAIGLAACVTGTSTGATGRRDYATIAYRATTGRRLWIRRYGGPGFLGATPLAIAVSPSGRTVFVAGIAPAPAGRGQSDRVQDYVTVAYSSRTGARL